MSERTDKTVSDFGRKSAPMVPGRAFSLVLFGLMAVLLLVALMVGLFGYRALIDERNDTEQKRLAYGSLVNTVKAFDALDAFSLGEYEGNDVLVMKQTTTTGTYVMRLYVHDGTLMQQYSLADAPLQPENAHGLFATETLQAKWENGLLTIATDAESPCIRLACAQPALDAAMSREDAGAAEAGDA